MADPLSGAASAIAVITLGFSTCKRLREIYDSVKDARSDIRALWDSINTLQQTLDALQHVLADAQLPAETAESARASTVSCADGLAKINEKLDKIARLAADPAVLTISILRRYTFREKTIAKLNARIHQELLAHLLVAVESLNLDVSLSIRRDFSDLSSKLHNVAASQTTLEAQMDSLHVGVNTIADIAANERLESQREKIIGWVASSDVVGEYHNSAYERREPGTCAWFLQGDAYSMWRETARSFLWAYGSPGCGKTILCSAIIAETISYCSFRPSSQFAYFYFSFADQRRQNTDNCLRAILRQLLIQRDTVPDRLVDIFKKYQYGTPPMHEWKIALDSVIQGPMPTYIVIDGLDECPVHQKERAKVLDLLEYLFKLNAANLHILVTSRRSNDIQDSLELLVTAPPLGIQETDTDADIRTHVTSQLASDKAMQKWPTSVKREVEDVLTAKANGMFRWIFCQLDALRRCRSPSAVSKTLNTLPKTLDETYERILLNISEEHQKEAQVALTWLVAANRELNVTELAEAAVFGFGSNVPFNPDDRFFTSDMILEILSGLVFWNRGAQSIRLAHFSVEEFLVSERLAESRARQFHVHFVEAQHNLAITSLNYLKWVQESVPEMSLPTFKAAPPRLIALPLSMEPGKIASGRAWKNFSLAPLISYACANWHVHLRAWHGYLGDEEIGLVEDFLRCPERVALFEMRTYTLEQRRVEYGCHDSRYIQTTIDPKEMQEQIQKSMASPLWYAARHGLVNVARALLEKSDQHQEPSSETLLYGNELRIACYYDHEEIVDLLISFGANVDAVGGNYLTPLGACMQSRVPNPSTVLKILKKSTEITGKSWNWIIGWVLRWAVMEGHLHVVQIILSKTTESVPGDFSWTCYYQKLFFREHHMFSTNTYYRQDMTGRESYSRCGTAPYEAASSGFYDILSLFMGKWDNIDEVDGDGRTALYWAVFKGHTKVVKLLLEHGASKYGHKSVAEWTPQYWARTLGHHEIELILSDSDLDLSPD